MRQDWTCTSCIRRNWNFWLTENSDAPISRIRDRAPRGVVGLSPRSRRGGPEEHFRPAPRKVIVGTLVQSFFVEYPGTQKRLEELEKFIDRMAEQSQKAYARGLDADGAALRRKYGEKVGFRYYRDEDLGIFWYNDPEIPIRRMIQSIGVTEEAEELQRIRNLYRKAGVPDL